MEMDLHKLLSFDLRFFHDYLSESSPLLTPSHKLRLIDGSRTASSSVSYIGDDNLFPNIWFRREHFLMWMMGILGEL
jgi:hypothetical protein